MSGNKAKSKDKGKSIRRAEDYQIATPTTLPLQNQFQIYPIIHPFLTKLLSLNHPPNQLQTIPTKSVSLNIYA